MQEPSGAERFLRPRSKGKLPAEKAADSTSDELVGCSSNVDNERQKKRHASVLLEMVSEMLDVPLPRSERSSSSEDSHLEDTIATLAKHVIPRFLRDSDEVVSQSKTSSLGGNLLQKIHGYLCRNVRVSGISMNKKGLHVGTGISYWVGTDCVRYGVICDLQVSAVGHLRIVTQLLYTQQETSHALFVTTKASSLDEAREMLSPFFGPDIFPSLAVDGVPDSKALKVMQSDSLTTLSIQNIKDVFSVCHSPLMYENASADEGTEDLTDSGELSKVLVIVGNVQTSAGRNQWNLKKLCLDPSTHQRIMMCVLCSFQTSDVNLRQHMIQTIRNHVFSSISTMAAGESQRQSILTIACPFDLFSQFCGLPSADLRWDSETRTWTASFEDPKELESLLGKYWYNVAKANDRGIVQVIGPLDLLYTHSRPASMRMILSKAAISGVGGMPNPLLMSFGSSGSR
jgi:hypothetical protein